MKQHIEVKKEIQEALNSKKAVVALESTIISHGMPYPRNVETALNVEKEIRSKGAVPATIAIINGKMKVGLTSDEIELLGKEGKNVLKVSRWDLPFVISAKKHGATTVASTMILANMAGVRVFATGGIGGVHRGAEKNFDISADLQELAHTNLAVICAGAKSILDLGLTVEYLETFGVPLIGYQTDKLPAFFARSSEYSVGIRLDTLKDVANFMKVKWDIGLNGGVVIANPIPKEFAMEESFISDVIEKAVVEAEKKGIHGKATTPFLLSKITEITGGSSLDSNIQLVYNNARLAAEIAVEYQKEGEF